MLYICLFKSHFNVLAVIVQIFTPESDPMNLCGTDVKYPRA